MTETEENQMPVAPRRPFRPGWIFPVLFRPRATLQTILQLDYATWLAPLLLLSVLALAQALVAGPLRFQAALNKPVDLPMDFQYWTEQDQQTYLESSQPKPNPMLYTVLPALGAVAGVWMRWFVLAAFLHLSLTLVGSRGASVADFSLAGWSSLPLAVRALLQLGVMIFSRRMIVSQGLAGFISAEASGLMAFVGVLLGLVDIYLIWQFILLVIGARGSSGLSLGKTLGAVLVALLLLVVLQAAAGFAGLQLSKLTLNGMF